MRRTLSVIIVSIALAFSLVPLAGPAAAVTCFDSAGYTQACPPTGYTECVDSYDGRAVSCDPCYVDKQHAAFDAELALMPQIRSLKERIHHQSVRLRERRAKIWFKNRKIRRLEAEVRRLRSAQD